MEILFRKCTNEAFKNIRGDHEDHLEMMSRISVHALLVNAVFFGK